MRERKISLEVDQSVNQILADAGYDPVYGARPLRRAIQHSILTPLSKILLQESSVEGTRVRIGSLRGAVTVTLVGSAQAKK